MSDDPASAVIWRARAEADERLAAGANPLDVLGLLTDALELGGEDPGLLSDIAVVLHACGRAHHATEVLLRAEQIDRWHPDVVANLGVIREAGRARREPDELEDASRGGTGPRVAVVGAESSGTRLVTRLVRDAGCTTLHRSFPYEGAERRHWPESTVAEFEPDAVVVVTRDWWACVASQLAAGHVPDEATAWANLREAQYRIARLVEGRDWCQVSYESLVQRPRVVAANLCATLGVEPATHEELYDGNDRYLGARELSR